MHKRLTTKQFIERAKKVHKDIFNYSKTIYINSHTKVIITCNIHGHFEQKPNNHLNNQGCKKCGIIRRTKTKKQFTENSNIIHNNFYDYSLVKYKRSDEKVIIGCPTHGNFEQTPSSHQIGKGCIKCAHEYVIMLNKERPKIWSYSGWQKNGEKSKHFDSFKVYVIKCWNKDEEFYKIGKTYTTLERRFGSTLLPYNYEIIELFENNSEYVSKLEHRLHKQNKLTNYTPLLCFAGMHECYKTYSI